MKCIFSFNYNGIRRQISEYVLHQRRQRTDIRIHVQMFAISRTHSSYTLDTANKLCARQVSATIILAMKINRMNQ